MKVSVQAFLHRYFSLLSQQALAGLADAASSRDPQVLRTRSTARRTASKRAKARSHPSASVYHQELSPPDPSLQPLPLPVITVNNTTTLILLTTTTTETNITAATSTTTTIPSARL